MASKNAKKAAHELLETLGKGEIVNMGKILKNNGYAKNTADSPRLVTETKSFKDVVNPVVKALEEEREEIIKALKKTRNKAKYRDLIDGLDKVTKNHQLLTGGQTENTGLRELADSINNWIEDTK